MAQVPSNLIPTTVTQLPDSPTASEDGLLLYVYQGNTYKIRAGDLLQVAGVPITRQVIAGTGMTGGGPLSSNITLSVAQKAIDGALLADTGVTPGQYGSATEVPRFTVDSTGRVTAVDTVPLTVSGYVPVTRQVIAGPGLTGGGALNANVTLGADFASSTPLSGQASGSAGSSLQLTRADHRHPAVDLADDAQVDNILGLSNGGTARSLVMQPGAVIYSGADGLYVGPAGAAGQVLVSGGTAAPTWGSTLILAPVTANYMFAGPAAGGAADPTFRAMVNADLPNSGVTAGSAGSGALVPVITVNSKGVVTGLSSTAVTPAWANVTGTPTTVAGYGITDAVTLTGTQVLTNKTLSGASNTFSNIGNSALTYSSVTINGSTVSLGGSATVTAASPYALTIGTGLSGSSYDGSAAVTIANSGVLSFNAGTTGLTPASDATGAVTLGGVLNVANGGTGASTAAGAPFALKGANTDITALTGITGAISTADYVDLDTGATVTSAVGRLFWNGGTTLNVGMTANVAGKVNEDLYYYIKASGAVTKGQVIMFTGAVGASGVVTGAPATGVSDGSYIMGVAAEDIALNGFGLVQYAGTLRGVDTSAFADGNVLWYNPAVAGGLTATQPSAPNIKVQIAAVINAASGGSGALLIRVTAGSVLGGTDSNVGFTSLTNNDLIQYYAAGGYWRNVAGPAGAVVGTTDTQTLTNKSISGATNTLSNIGNSALTYSSITINGNAVSLGGSTTVTAAAPNALTIGTGLSGTSYNGSAAVTIAIDSTVATLTGAQTLTNKTLTAPVISTISNTGTLTLPTTTDTLVGRATTDTLTNKSISGSSNTLSNIGNSALTNSAVTINGNSVSLGGSTTVTAVAPNALTIGTGLSGVSYNGSAAVTVAIDSTVATLTGTQTLINKSISGSTNTLSNIPNSALTNSAVTVNGVSISLGASGTITAAAPNALTLGSYLTGISYNGSAAVTAAVDATSANTASKVVARDSSGNFSANVITAVGGIYGGAF